MGFPALPEECKWAKMKKSAKRLQPGSGVRRALRGGRRWKRPLRSFFCDLKHSRTHWSLVMCKCGAQVQHPSTIDHSSLRLVIRPNLDIMVGDGKQI